MIRSVSRSSISRLKTYNTFASSLNKPFHTSFTPLNPPVNLELSYQAILRHLVRKNLPTLNEILKQVPDSINRESDSDKNSDLSLLYSSVDPNVSIDLTIKKLAKLLNSNYNITKTTRLQIPRRKAPISDYNRFLVQLYPKSNVPEIKGVFQPAGRKIRYAALYQSYKRLPKPQPLYIQPQHLEDLISVFMGSIKADLYDSIKAGGKSLSAKQLRLNKSHKKTDFNITNTFSSSLEVSVSIFEQLLNDLKAAGMPVSHHETNSVLQMAILGYYRDYEMASKFNIGLPHPYDLKTYLKTNEKVYGNVRNHTYIINENNINDFLKLADMSPSLKKIMALETEVESHSDRLAAIQGEPSSSNTVTDKKFNSVLQEAINASRQHDSEISFINIRYKFALNTKNETMLKDTIAPLQEGKVCSNRITYMLEMIQAGRSKNSKEIQKIYQEMIKTNHVVDIGILNVLIKELLQAQDRANAEKVFQMVLKRARNFRDGNMQRKLEQEFEISGISQEEITKPGHEGLDKDSTQLNEFLIEPNEKNKRVIAATTKLKEPSSSPPINLQSKLLNQLQLIDFIQRLVCEQKSVGNSSSSSSETSQSTNIQSLIPIIPDSFTFGTLFGYYCVQAGDIHAALKLVPIMQEFDYKMGNFHYSMIFDGFIKHGNKPIKSSSSSSLSDEIIQTPWTPKLLNLVTKLLHSQYEDEEEEFQVAANTTTTNSNNSGGIIQNGSKLNWNSNSNPKTIPSVSFTKDKALSVAHDPFTYQVCMKIFKAYLKFYPSARSEILNLRAKYLKALEPTTKAIISQPSSFSSSSSNESNELKNGNNSINNNNNNEKEDYSPAVYIDRREEMHRVLEKLLKLDKKKSKTKSTRK